MQNESAVRKFKASLAGSLVQPGDEDYNEVRKVYNGMIDKRPRMIARCASVADVITSVNFARENNLCVAIRGGGHNAGGLGIWEDALVIDLSLMKNIQTNVEEKTVLVQAGCLIKELDEATHEIGMAVPAGIIGTTGIAGLTLGGGSGYLTRQYGLTIDNLLEAHVVLADGRYVRASSTENKDLFWAIRGGGGNFGVVISFLFKLHPVHTVYAGPMFWDLGDTVEMLKWYRDFMVRAPEELYGFFATLTVPPADPFPEALQLKKVCGIIWCHTGPVEEAEKAFQPIRDFKKPLLDWVKSIPFPALQTMFDRFYPTGMQWYWKGDFVNELSDKAIDLHFKYAKELPTWRSTMHLFPINCAAAKVGKKDTAWNFRDANWSEVIVGVDPDPENKELIIKWARDYWNDLHPYSAGGAYVNFMMEEGDERIRAAYGENYERLVAIKNKYDPNNFFRVNQNIRPMLATSPGEI
jgi:hypothetical protein